MLKSLLRLRKFSYAYIQYIDMSSYNLYKKIQISVDTKVDKKN